LLLYRLSLKVPPRPTCQLLMWHLSLQTPAVVSMWFVLQKLTCRRLGPRCGDIGRWQEAVSSLGALPLKGLKQFSRLAEWLTWLSTCLASARP
jgi:hypothetical protein